MSGKLKEVRNRIKSVISTQQITNAMKMVSAAKLRRATEAIHRMRPYAASLSEIMSHLVKSAEGQISLAFAEPREPEKVMIVLITSDRGLCGAFNSNLIKTAQQLIDTTYRTQFEKGNVRLLCIGKRGKDFFKKRDYNIDDRFVELFYNLNFENASKVADYLMNAFLSGEVDRIELVYSEFKNAAVQIFRSERFLPVEVQEEKPDDKLTNFIFEPDQKTIIEVLVPRILRTQLFKALLDSNASEHGARMTAMDNATENATQLLRELRIAYNRARQATITTELVEIVSGANALKESN